MSDMSRKEAVEHLKDLDDIVGLDAYGRKAITIDIEDIKAIRMAIASLETDEAYQLEYEKPKFCEDCVSRKAVCEWYCNTTCNMDYCTEPCLEHKELCELPSVLPKADAPETNVGKIGSTTKNDLVVEKTDMIDKSNFSQEQYKTDLQSAYDCGYAQAKNDLGVDAVSRKAVLHTLDRMDSALDVDRTVETYKDLLKECYKVLPSVTPQEPKAGHWKLVQRGKAIDVCCSNCGAVRIKGYAYNYTIDELNKEDINECFGSAEMRYCPNCGSDNREVEE